MQSIIVQVQQTHKCCGNMIFNVRFNYGESHNCRGEYILKSLNVIF